MRATIWCPVQQFDGGLALADTYVRTGPEFSPSVLLAMSQLRNYRDLDVWNRSMDLVVDVYELTRSFPNFRVVRA